MFLAIAILAQRIKRIMHEISNGKQCCTIQRRQSLTRIGGSSIAFRAVFQNPGYCGANSCLARERYAYHIFGCKAHLEQKHQVVSGITLLEAATDGKEDCEAVKDA